MKFLQKSCALLIVLSVMTFSALAQDQQDKTPPKKEKPKVEVVPKKPDDNRDKDRDKDDKRGDKGKKPGEEV